MNEDIITKPVVIFGPPPEQTHRKIGNKIYKAAEIEKAAQRCHYIPIVIDHPPKNTKATHDDNYNHLATFGVGFVCNVKAINGRLVGDAVISVPKVMKMTWWYSDMAGKIRRGEPVEVSVAWGHTDMQSRLKSQIEPVVVGLLPLHLALVSRGPGLCSVSEGYGLGVNYE